MQLLKRDRSGLSEIVGALMLVLIVVIAASSFAVFISQYQANAQAQQLKDQERSQEKISVMSVTPVMGADGNEWYSFNFTIASLNDEESTITQIAVNDHTVIDYYVTWMDPNTGKLQYTNMTTPDQLTLDPREQVSIYVPVGEPGTLYGPASFSVNDYVKIDITTAWGNVFSKSFIPPSSVISAPTQGSWLNKSSGAYETYLTLNGRSSVAYNGAYIVSWNWTVTSVGLDDPVNKTVVTHLSGSICNFYLPFSNASHRVNLTVTDNYGMVGVSSFPLYYS